MSLHLIYGSPVSDLAEHMKMHILSEAKAHPELDFVMLVPDQASLFYQQELVERAENHGLLNVDIMTFGRLSYHVFQETHEEEKKILSETGKLMLLRLVSGEKKDELKVLRRGMQKPGFMQELKSVISELSQYNIQPEQLRKEIEDLSGHTALQNKLSDISVLYTAFTALLHENYEMREERLLRLSKTIGKWNRLSRTVFYLDGFTGFTPLQYAVLREILGTAPAVVLSVTVGTGYIPEEHRNTEALFHMSYEMGETMKKLSEEVLSGKVKTPFTEEVRSAQSGQEYSREIFRIEREIFRERVPDHFPHTERIRIQGCKTQREEVQLVLSEILKEVRNGARYRDLSVVLGAPESYLEEIESQFSEAGIPYFLDTRRPLSRDPLHLLVRESLEVLKRDFSFDAVYTYAKNPIVLRYLTERLSSEADSLDAFERVTELENYALALGIRGRGAYEKELKYRYRRLAKGRLSKINSTKKQLAAPLLQLSSVLSDGTSTVRMKTEAMVWYLEEVQAFSYMNEAGAAYGERMDTTRESVFLRSYGKLMDLFSQLVSILGDEVLPLETYIEVLTEGLSDEQIGVVPTKDRLVVGDLMRTRLSGIRKLFIIGANEGLLPVRTRESGLLSDLDREILTGSALKLSPTAREESFRSRYYLYLLLTAPREAIFMTYAFTGSDGKSREPAQIVRQLSELFPGCDRKMRHTERLGFSNSKEEGMRTLVSELREYMEEQKKAETTEKQEPFTGNPDTAALFSVLQKKDPETVQRILSAMFYEYKEEVLNQEVSRYLQSGYLAASSSRLEEFAGCAFRHFLDYGLQLSEREVYEIDERQYGTLFHDCMDRFFRNLTDQGKHFGEISEEECKCLAELSVDQIVREQETEILSENSRNEYLKNRLNRVTERTLRTLRFQWQQGDYSETASEVQFGGKDAENPPLRIPLSETQMLLLNGRIDRMDLRTEGGRTFLRIIDYKSSEKKIDFTKMYYGLQLQLLYYLAAAEEIAEKRHPGQEVIPAGVYYYHMDDPMVEASPEDAEKAILQKLRMNGITNAEPDVLPHTEEVSGASMVVSGLKVKKDGGFQYETALTDTEGMQALKEFALNRAKSLSSDILSGRITVDPYSYQGTTACKYCPFRGRCGFDPRIPGYRERRLKKKTIADISGGGKEESDEVHRGTKESH